MKPFNKLLLACCITLTVASCSKDDNLDIPLPVGLGGDSVARNTIDQWLIDNLTKPYNINVKYRWDPFEVGLDKTLTPPQEDKIITAMSAIKNVWIQPYNDETGSDLFIKKYSPKQFVLVGSVEYNYNGTVVLGQAEGGNNISFFDINQNFDKDPVSSVRRMIHTSHHEFAHILHQTVMYPQDFKFITANLGLPGYTATWFNVDPADALENGYITPYAMASYDEDFVETVANMLLEGKTRFDELVESTNPTAQQALRNKEQIVVTYFRDTWKIDFYSLQRRVQKALVTLAPPPAINDVYGYNKAYTGLSTNPVETSLLPQSAAFKALYKSVADSIANFPGGTLADFPKGLVMDSMVLIDATSTRAVLEIYYNDAVNPSKTSYTADYVFSRTKSSANVYSYGFLGVTTDEADILFDAVLPLLRYFVNNQFTLEWYADPSVTIYPRGKLVPKNPASPSFIGRLVP